jgi:hypothetical protein
MKRIIATLAVVVTLGIGLAGRADDVDVRYVGPDQTDVLTTTISAGDWTEIRVIGDHSTDLDLFVYDPLGHLLVSDVGPTDNCQVSFSPPLTGTYTIRVVNRSPTMGNVYAIGIR